MTLIKLIAAGITTAALATAVLAQSGPVGNSCQADIAKHCAGKPHDGSVRICLEQNYEQLSAACKAALDTTGGGRGKGLMKGKAR